jgi:hypothetical protein
MKKIYRISGDLESTDIELLKTLFQIPGMSIRSKNSEELFVKNDNVDLHIYESTTSPSESKDYLIGGTIEDEFLAVEKLIKEIASLLERNNVVYNFEFYQDCLSGEVSEEFVIKHPNY